MLINGVETFSQTLDLKSAISSGALSRVLGMCLVVLLSGFSSPYAYAGFGDDGGFGGDFGSGSIERDVGLAEGAPLRKYLETTKRSPVLLIRCMNKGGEASGSGCIVEMEGRQYIVTNQHVVFAPDKLDIRNLGGIRFAIRSFEVHPTLDLVRMRFSTSENVELDAFKPAEKVQMDQKTYAIGNSKGRRVATLEAGTVNGISGQFVEITNRVVGGNSGGAVVDEEGKLIGVVSHAIKDAPSWLANDTRYGDVRRFGIRVLEEYPWKNLSEKAYQKYIDECHFISDFYTYCGKVDTLTNVDWEKEYIEVITPYYAYIIPTYVTGYDLAAALRYFSDYEKHKGGFYNVKVCKTFAKVCDNIMKVYFPNQNAVMKGSYSDSYIEMLKRRVRSSVKQMREEIVKMREVAENNTWTTEFLVGEVQGVLGQSYALDQKVIDWSESILGEPARKVSGGGGSDGGGGFGDD
jgi:hypothetical protein